MENKPTDAVHPRHYTEGIEPIDYIRSYMSKDEFYAFCAGNVIKYVTRYSKKNGRVDLLKAARYLSYMIEYEKDLNE